MVCVYNSAYDARPVLFVGEQWCNLPGQYTFHVHVDDLFNNIARKRAACTIRSKFITRTVRGLTASPSGQHQGSKD